MLDSGSTGILHSNDIRGMDDEYLAALQSFFGVLVFCGIGGRRGGGIGRGLGTMKKPLSRFFHGA